MLRVIGGKYKGRTLESADLPGLRPTSDRVREALFSILNSRIRIDEATVLELFAGTGAVGIEALSRGALHCTFIERERKTITMLERNLERLGASAQATIIRADVVSWLEHPTGQYDLIIADPPYASLHFHTLTNRIFEHNLLSANGIFVLEHSAEMISPPSPMQGVLLDERIHGNTKLVFYGRDTDTTL